MTDARSGARAAAAAATLAPHPHSLRMRALYWLVGGMVGRGKEKGKKDGEGTEHGRRMGGAAV